MEFDNNFIDEKNPDPKVKKLRVTFLPLDQGENPTYISGLYSLSNGKRSRLYALLTAMSPEGSIPEEIRKSHVKYQEFAESLIGMTYQIQVTMTDDGKYNKIMGVTFLAAESKQDPVIQKLLDLKAKGDWDKKEAEQESDNMPF